MIYNMHVEVAISVDESIDKTHFGRPTRNEFEWMQDITSGTGKFNYVAKPTPLVREVLERVFGPLDYEIPYV
jgi:hypothetical protein